MRAHDQRIQFAMERREDAIESYKRNDLIGADEAYGEVIQMVEKPQAHGRTFRVFQAPSLEAGGRMC
eukprot:g30924.t1